MTVFRIVAAAALTECACASGRVRMVQSMLAVDDPMWGDLLKMDIESFGIEVCEIELEWIEWCGVAVLVLELTIERPVSNDVPMSYIVAQACESIRRSARFDDERRIASRAEVLSNLERETADLSRYVDVVTMGMLEHGAVFDSKRIAAEVGSISVREVVRIVDELLSPENFGWEFIAVP